MAGAILCLLFSTTYHLFNPYSEKVSAFLSRLDYGGISLLIAGSTFPPVMYGFACNPVPRVGYAAVISTTCLSAFVLTLMPGADTPKYRRMRGFLFICVGLFAGIPAIHASSSNDPNIILNCFYWILGGIIYVTGALIYVGRIPERFAPGKFDFIGQSHNIFHLFILVAAIFHFLGSMESYNLRKNSICPIV
eukprot:TRINITY_DN9610_c0_g3_i10.p2 TRINITY_DN9610_c0_g3~~TRINITY_DN9610_c0_g3_i10.p2  ORF type:complete len:192 (-),score=41.99 TRINITY_DN9610_c0_g3_i10:143-718(-)